MTKPSPESFTELPPGLKSKTEAILNIKKDKLKYLRLCITAVLYPVTDHATKENKDINNLVEVWEHNK